MARIHFLNAVLARLTGNVFVVPVLGLELFLVADFLWIRWQPPWPHEMGVLFLSLLFPPIVALLTYKPFALADRSRVRRNLVIVSICTTAFFLVYIALSARFVLELPDRFHKEVIGWSYTGEVAKRSAEKTDRELVDYSGRDVDRVFSAGSLVTMRVLLLSCWLTLIGCFTPVIPLALLRPQSESKPPSIDGLFICYRRQDSGLIAARIKDWLVLRYGKDKVFFDMHSIPYGTYWEQVIHETIQKCNALLVIIGPLWVSIPDEQTGVPRLHNPTDPVRREIEIALARGVPTIPVAVLGATIPAENQLPASLHALGKVNGPVIADERHFEFDVKKLMSDIERHVVGVG
jgi:hypothetical protein